MMMKTTTTTIETPLTPWVWKSSGAGKRFVRCLDDTARAGGKLAPYCDTRSGNGRSTPCYTVSAADKFALGGKRTTRTTRCRQLKPVHGACVQQTEKRWSPTGAFSSERRTVYLPLRSVFSAPSLLPMTSLQRRRVRKTEIHEPRFDPVSSALSSQCLRIQSRVWNLSCRLLSMELPASLQNRSRYLNKSNQHRCINYC